MTKPKEQPEFDPVRDAHESNGAPCPRCLPLAFAGKIPVECVQPLPRPGIAPRAVSDNHPCCFDCAAADTVTKMMRKQLDFEMARVAVANDRSEQYRLPGMPMGLVLEGWVKPSRSDDFEVHRAWMDRVGLTDQEA